LINIIIFSITLKIWRLRVRLVRELGGERRGGILTEGRGDILIKSVFGSQGEGRDFKIILLFYP